MKRTCLMIIAICLPLMICGPVKAQHTGPYVGAFIGGNALMTAKSTDDRCAWPGGKERKNHRAGEKNPAGHKRWKNPDNPEQDSGEEQEECDVGYQSRIPDQELMKNQPPAKNEAG